MKIEFWTVGRKHEAYVQAGIEDFTKRINNYYKCDWLIINPPKMSPATSVTEVKKKEADVILPLLHKDQHLVLLDEKGKSFTSPQLAQFIDSRAVQGTRQLIFLIGGAYGVDSCIVEKAHTVWSLSTLVFPHQLVRLILAEQVYRACTINKNEKYHHT